MVPEWSEIAEIPLVVGCMMQRMFLRRDDQ